MAGKVTLFRRDKPRKNLSCMWCRFGASGNREDQFLGRQSRGSKICWTEERCCLFGLHKMSQTGLLCIIFGKKTLVPFLKNR